MFPRDWVPISWIRIHDGRRVVEWCDVINTTKFWRRRKDAHTSLKQKLKSGYKSDATLGTPTNCKNSEL